MNIAVHIDRVCKPDDVIIGYKDEKNIDKISLELDSNIPDLKWYLLFDENLIPFNGKELVIDDRLTSRSGNFPAYIIGTDAPEGCKVTDGNTLFHSDKIIMRVKGR